MHNPTMSMNIFVVYVNIAPGGGGEQILLAIRVYCSEQGQSFAYMYHRYIQIMYHRAIKFFTFFIRLFYLLC